VPRQIQFAVDRLRAQGSQQHTFLGALLQLALRILLIVFIAVTSLIEPPRSSQWICLIIVAAYIVAVACWSVWALRPAAHAVRHIARLVTLMMLGADIAVVSILTVLTGITSPEDWTSDVLRNGLFLLPLIAAAQLNPDISAVIAAPTVLALVAASWVTKSSNQEPWSSILLSATVLAGLAAGSVALSRIQQSKVEMIEELARQRTQLLQELLAVEKRERRTAAERVHDGALHHVLVARQDLHQVRSGSVGAVARVESSLTEASELLRDVARALDPQVLARLGVT
jgi:two-component system, NarL family, sensor kinase